jgi:hypothetical protein
MDDRNGPLHKLSVAVTTPMIPASSGSRSFAASQRYDKTDASFAATIYLVGALQAEREAAQPKEG